MSFVDSTPVTGQHRTETQSGSAPSAHPQGHRQRQWLRRHATVGVGGHKDIPGSSDTEQGRKEGREKKTKRKQSMICKSSISFDYVP